jgi:hypothetical protein
MIKIDKRRFARTICIMPTLSDDRRAAFEELYIKAGADDCWPWTGARDSDGYGSFKLSLYTTVGAHRIAWCIANGAEPGRGHVLHSCDNPPCVNPNHLSLGTARINAQDKVQKGRARGRFSDYQGSFVARGPVHEAAPENDKPWFLRGLPGG